MGGFFSRMLDFLTLGKPAMNRRQTIEVLGVAIVGAKLKIPFLLI